MSKPTKSECAKIFSELTRPFIRPYLMGRLNGVLIIDDTIGYRRDLLIIQDRPANDNLICKAKKEGGI